MCLHAYPFAGHGVVKCNLKEAGLKWIKKKEMLSCKMPNQHVEVIATRGSKGWQLAQVHKGIRCLMGNENIFR